MTEKLLDQLIRLRKRAIDNGVPGPEATDLAIATEKIDTLAEISASLRQFTGCDGTFQEVVYPIAKAIAEIDVSDYSPELVEIEKSFSMIAKSLQK